MNKFVVALAAILALPTVANAAPCKDAKGKFIKCPPAATVTHAPAAAARHAATAPRPVATHAAASPARRAPCRDARGRFKKC
jgi:hypothetical protein